MLNLADQCFISPAACKAAIQSLCSTCTAAREEQYEAFMQIKWNGNITDLFTALSGIVAQFAD